jgi:hypothetical protein
MGGYGSTRWGYHARRCTVEESLPLRVSDLRRGLRTHGAASLAAGWSSDDRGGAEIRMELGPSELEVGVTRFGQVENQLRRKLTLRYAASIMGETFEGVDQCANLTARPMRFGGYRWWFACPRCAVATNALYLPLVAGARRWGCRKCFGLKYETQRVGPIGRAETRMQRVASRTYGAWWPDWFYSPPPRPKRMRTTTYTRYVAAWDRASDARDSISIKGC